MDRKTPWLAGLVGAFGLAVSALAEPGCESSTPATPQPTTPGQTLDCGNTNDGGDWPMYGGDICNTRTVQGSPGAINPANAKKLGVKWTYDAAGDISATPAVVGGRVYVPDWGGMLNCLESETGHVVWSRSISDILGGTMVDAGGDGAVSAGEDSGANDAGSAAADAGDGGGVDAAGADAGSEDAAPQDANTPDAMAADAGEPADGGRVAVADAGVEASAPIRVTSGMVARSTPVVTGGLVIFGVGSFPGGVLAAVDQNTGSLVWQRPLDAHPAAVVTASPVVDNGRIYVGVSSAEEGFPALMPGYACCSFRGSVAAVDAATGRVLWQTPMIDDSVFRNADGTLSGFAGAAVWSGPPAIDRKRKLLYVTTGNNYSTPPTIHPDAGSPLPEGDRVESIVALDLDTGKIRWSQRMTTDDIWTFSNMSGPDYDFGDGAHLYQATFNGAVHDVVGAGQKSGIYWAVDPDTGAVLWKTAVGPGGHLGGIHWGSAVDGTRIYVGVNNETGQPYTLGGSGVQAGTSTKVGSWAALDPATGAVLWQVKNDSMAIPLNRTSVNGPLTVVNGVVFAGSMDADGTMYALDAATGEVLWSFKSGGTVYSGPAVANGVVYWGNGYPMSRLFFGSPGHKLFAFDVGN